MKANTNWYWEPEKNQHILILSTRMIVHTCTYVSIDTDMLDIPIYFLKNREDTGAFSLFGIGDDF